VEFAVISQKNGNVVFEGYSDDQVSAMLKEEGVVATTVAP
jgi:hypothetical protein